MTTASLGAAADEQVRAGSLPARGHGSTRDVTGAVSQRTTDAVAYGINDKGWVTGWSKVLDPSHPDADMVHAVVWLPHGQGMVDLSSFPPGRDTNGSVAFAASPEGMAVGTGNSSDGQPGSAKLWNTTDGRTTFLPGNGEVAHDINAHGQVAGWGFVAGRGTRAFIWRAGGHHRVVLGTLGGDRSEANANNALGQVAGFSTTPSGGVKAFLWDPTTRRMSRLSGFPAGTGWTVANDINDTGQVVGTYSRSTARGPHRAFLWHPRTRSVTDLRSLGGDWASATAINDRGVIVGQAARRDGTKHACVWSAQSRRMTMLPGVPAPSAALGINDRGQVVGVYGLRTKHAFLWRPRTQTMVTLPTLTPS